MPTLNFTKPNNTRPSKPMISYMEILFNDTGFTGIEQRNVWLQHNFAHRRIKFLDDLTMCEGIAVIKKLKEIRGDKS